MSRFLNEKRTTNWGDSDSDDDDFAVPAGVNVEETLVMPESFGGVALAPGLEQEDEDDDDDDEDSDSGSEDEEESSDEDEAPPPRIAAAIAEASPDRSAEGDDAAAEEDALESKPVEQLSKKERKELKARELEDLDRLLSEFGVAEQTAHTEQENAKPAEDAEENAVADGQPKKSGKKKKRRKGGASAAAGDNQTGTAATTEAAAPAVEPQEANGTVPEIAERAGGPAADTADRAKGMSRRKKRGATGAKSTSAMKAAAAEAKKAKKDKKKKDKKHFNQMPTRDW